MYVHVFHSVHQKEIDALPNVIAGIMSKKEVAGSNTNDKIKSTFIFLFLMFQYQGHNNNNIKTTTQMTLVITTLDRKRQAMSGVIVGGFKRFKIFPRTMR